MCLKAGLKIASTVGTSPAVIAASQRISWARTAAHGPTSSGSGALVAASKQVSAATADAGT
jgi:hypothetical protein